ncbi:MAG: hypothetical protein J6N70_18070 [Oribacterium sp.]|nr:hypothetical protein [Oribacterium sp.]
MKSYLYTPFELALIIQYHHMDSERYIELLQNIFRHDNIFIQPEYRHDQKGFILAVMDKLDYLNDPDAYMSELSEIEKDMNDLGLKNNSASGDTDHGFSHLIFKELRIRIQYINQKGIAKMKLRTLLLNLGYKRRSQNVMRYINDCLLFYHIETTLKRKVHCIIDNVKMDDVIVFRTV